MMVALMQMLMDLVAPTHPKVARWYRAQKWAEKQRDAGNPRYASFKTYYHGAALFSFLDDLQSCCFPDFDGFSVTGREVLRRWQA